MGEKRRGQGLGHNLYVPTEGKRAGASPSQPDYVLFSAREQRVTGTIVFILTGVSVFLAPVLKVRLCTLLRGPSAWETTGLMPEVGGGFPHGP